jgi:hypothetical protein
VFEKFGLFQKLREERQEPIRCHLGVVIPRNSNPSTVPFNYSDFFAIFFLTRWVSYFQLAVSHIPDYYQELSQLQAFLTAEFRMKLFWRILFLATP